ncbi:MAG: 4-hydroxyphenylacetate 3-hydroxylase C-terminal domain-containing protein, partial [Peptostreptococcales bacterium]
AHANKYNVGYFPWLTKRLCQDICGGLVETGCFPSYKDFQSKQYGDKLKKYFKAGPASAEVRAKAARVAEWLTVGGGIPGCMHGGGSPDGARLVVRLHTPIEEFVGYAKRVAKIDEDIPDPAANKK